MKAIILLAGVGSRMSPLTDKTHKSLLKIGDRTILFRMLKTISAVGIKDFIFVTGNKADQLKAFALKNFPKLHFSFIYNEKYLKTNTGYSLMLALKELGKDSFIKVDGDVVFEKRVLERLIKSRYENCLCIDRRIHLDKEEIKVRLKDDMEVIEVGKKIDPKLADGESIGIEKLSNAAGKALYSILEENIIKKNKMMDYYDDYYPYLAQKGIPFHAVDISELKAIEVDIMDDYKTAQDFFGKK